MSRRVQEKLPVRRGDVVEQPRYQLYRVELREDFSGSCGYCGDSDHRADKSTFHIDHFAPKKQFPQLKVVYGNLVYACRFCNVSKSNHWIGEDPAVSHDGERGFIDPCLTDYEAHLERTETGRIVGRTALGRYMVKRLNLTLIRHELLWRARRARSVRDEIKSLIVALKDHPNGDDSKLELLERFFELTELIEDYEYRAAEA